MSAAQRIAALDDLPARDLIAFTEGTLRALVEIMNKETMLLRAGRHRDAGELTAEKTRLAQDYVSYSRAVQRQMDRLKVEAPNAVDVLKLGHEQLATQMAENLKVIAVAKAVTEDLLTDVAQQVARASRPKTYGAGGELSAPPRTSSGITLNRAL
jgi:flagellar biosynthesis/type III secretory pathway chaperone